MIKKLRELRKMDGKTLIKTYKAEFLLMLIVIGAFFLNFFAISKVGYANEYYSAAIKSMSMSFKNFFFAAFDPSGRSQKHDDELA